MFRPVDEDFVSFATEALDWLKQKAPSHTRIDTVVMVSDFVYQAVVRNQIYQSLPVSVEIAE